MKAANTLVPLLLALAGVHSAIADDIDTGQVELDMTGIIVAEAAISTPPARTRLSILAISAPGYFKASAIPPNGSSSISS